MRFAGLALLLLVPTARAQVVDGRAAHASAKGSIVQVHVDARWDTAAWVLRSSSLGAGIALREGWLLTNAHVVDEASSITVVDADGAPHEADLWRWSSIVDVGVIRVPGLDLPAPRLAEPAVPGLPVFALGHPFGAPYAITSGVVSAIGVSLSVEGRQVDPLCSLIQFDAQANPGNSGGGLFDAEGRLVGLVAKSLDPLGAAGACFAVPAPLAVAVAERLVAGRFQHGAIHVATSQGLGAPDAALARIGVRRRGCSFVTEVVPGMASAAGLRPGDVILSVQGISVTRNVQEVAARFAAGERVRLAIERAGAPLELEVVLDPWKGDPGCHEGRPR